MEIEEGYEQEVEAETAEEVGEHDSLETPEKNQGLMRLSLHSMVGLKGERSMRIKGKIAHRSHCVDCLGRNEQFHSPEVVRTIGLFVTKTRGFLWVMDM